MRFGMRAWLSGFVLTVSLATVQPALAQFGGFGGQGGRPQRGGGFNFDSVTFVIQREDVQGELKLTDEQKEKIREQQNAFRDDPKLRDFFDRLRNAAGDEERKTIGDEMRQYQEGQIKTILKPDQFTRLQQLSFQRQGTRALESDEGAKAFNLTDAQKEKMRAASEEYDKAREELFRNRDLPREERDAKLAEMRAARDKAVESLLDSTQRKQMEEKRGSTFTFQEQQGGFGGFGGQRPGGNNNDNNRRGGNNNNPPPRRPDTPIGSTTIVPGAPLPGATAAADGSAVAAAPAIVSFGQEKAGGKKLEKMSFNFRYAPWQDVLKLFAESAGLTLDLNDVPPGTFNYYDERQFTPMEALDVLNGYLLQKGYVLVRRDEFLVVLNIDVPIPPNLVPTVGLDELPKRGRNELMTVIIPLTGMTPNEAVEEVRELLGPQGKAVALTKTSRILVTDIGQNLRRVHELLSNLNVEVGDKQFKQYHLKFVTVVEADNIVRDLFGLPHRGVENVSAGGGFDSRDRDRGGFGGGSGSSRPSAPTRTDPNARVQVAVDERTNTLLITAKADDIRIIDDAIKTIDIQQEGEVAKGNKTPYLEVYALKSADPQEVAKTMNVLFPGSVVNEDARARRIHIHASAEQHDRIRETIRRLDGEGGTSQVAVVPLGRMDAYTATASIQSLFVTEGNAAPVVQPHPLGTGLIVRGTPDQVEQIKLLMAELDPTSVGAASQQGNVRTVPLGGRNPEQFLKALEQVWNAKSRTPIRTVIPSNGSTTIDRRVPAGSQDSDTTPSASKDERLDRILNNPPANRTPRDSTSGEARRSEPQPEIKKAKVDNLDSVSTQELRRAVSEVVAVVATGEEDDEDQLTDQDAANEFNKLFDELEGVQKPTEKKAEPAAKASESAAEGSDAPIMVTVNNGNLVLMSDDPRALDQLEDTITSLARAIPAKTEWTIFYLRSADSLETATVLERLFPSSSVSTTVGGSSGMMGELTSGISSMGRGIMDLTGMNSLTSGPQTLRIVPDTRTNALMVSGPPHLVSEVEQMLEILDASETPEQLRNRAPRYINVKHAEISDVAEMIRDIYKEELEPDRGGQNNPLAALMGGGGGGSRGGSRGQTQAQVKLTLSVDSRASRLIVSCSEPLFKQIETMVEQIDSAALESKRTVRVVSLENVKSNQLKAALGAVMPKVKVSTSRSSGGGGGGSGGGGQPQQQPNPDEVRQLIQQQQQRSSGGSGGFGGGGSPFGGGRGFGGGGFGGGGFGGGGRGGR